MVKKAKQAVKGLLRTISSAFGYDIHVLRRDSKSDWALLDRFSLSSYFNKNRNRTAYERSLAKSNMVWSDNFTKQCRHYSLYQLVEAALKADPGADAAECGCWWGHSTHIIGSLLKERGFKGRFNVFDSFEGGLSDPAPEDANERFAMTKGEVAELKQAFASTEEAVAKVMSEFDFVKFYKGWIPTRFDEVKDRRFCFAHIDVDMYQPTLDSLRFFYPRLVDGGIIVIDDYGYSQFPGAKKAVDEFLADKPGDFFYEVPTGAAFIVKAGFVSGKGGRAG